MTAAITADSAGYAGSLDVSQTSRVPMSRLLRVELRKMVDTRAGMWLMIAIAVLTTGVLIIFLANADHKTFVNAMQASAIPQSILLPVLGILLITQEWSQRTGMVTFTLEPHRGKVLWSKVAAAIVLGLAAVAVSMVVATVVTLLGGSAGAWHGVTVGTLLQYVLLEVIGVVGGLVFGLLLLNSAAAIVLSFAIPIAFSIVTSLWKAIKDAQPWIDPGTAQTPLQQGDVLSSHQWAHLAVSSLIWVVLPFVIGLWRVLRAEVK
ncbi:MAG TPA: ABC transporter permease [Marmoricola sp.]|nr:ABC transporter permease [Marmoricola sp.]